MTLILSRLLLADRQVPNIWFQNSQTFFELPQAAKKDKKYFVFVKLVSSVWIIAKNKEAFSMKYH